MFDAKKFEEMPKYEEFSVWFIQSSVKRGLYRAVKKEDHTLVIAEQDESGWKINSELCEEGQVNSTLMTLEVEFERFKRRPEYFVGEHIHDLYDIDMVDVYETLLVGVAGMRAVELNRKNNPDDEILRCMNVTLSWLRSTDMYTCPASTRYHEAFSGGLLMHILKVYNLIVDLKYQVPGFERSILASAALVALVHDWCKIGFYESYKKNVKNETTGQWEKEDAFRYRQEPLGVSLGHGVSSMFLANRCFHLTVEEALAIRWHMGWCRVVHDEMNELQNANESIPLVHLLQFADQLSIVSYSTDQLEY